MTDEHQQRPSRGRRFRLKPRGYIHFDKRMPAEFFLRYVRDLEKISRHAFFPFLSYIKEIPKYNKELRKTKAKERPIRYAGHLDSAIYAYYSKLLDQYYEEVIEQHQLGEHVIAYRSLGKSNVDFAGEAFKYIRSSAPCTALAFDVTKFFDTMDHELLRELWCRTIRSDRLPQDHYNVFKSITRYSWVDRDQVYKEFGLTSGPSMKKKLRICSANEFRDRVRGNGLIITNDEGKGIPQGSPISAALSNIYMIDFDIALSSETKQKGVFYRRYCDDVLVICNPDHEEYFKQLIKAEINKLNIDINDDKTEQCHFSVREDGRLQTDKALQYLGLIFDGQRQLLRPATIARFYRKLKRGAHAMKTLAAKHGNNVNRKFLYEKYTHLGKRNFFTYVRRATDSLRANEIKRQLRRHWQILHSKIDEQPD